MLRSLKANKLLKGFRAVKTPSLNAKQSRYFSAVIFNSAEDAIADIPHGATIGFGGFGLVGIPEKLIAALRDKGVKDITAVSNEAGVNGHGLDQLVINHQIKKLICSFVGNNKNFEKQYFNGDVELELVPQGSFAEKLRAGGAGIPAFYTRTGVGTVIGEGGLVKKFNIGGVDVEKATLGKEMRIFNGKRYLMVHSITADYGCIKGHVADEYGNVCFNKTALNFNADIAKASRCAIVEVEKIVPAGSLDPHHIQLPHIYVDRLFVGKDYVKPIEQYTIKKEGENAKDSSYFQTEEGKVRKKIAERAAKFVKDRMYINLGIGIPVLIPNFLDPELFVTFQGENGILGLGEFPYEHEVDPDLINAGKQVVTVVKGGAFMTSSETFAMIRGGHIDITFLGGMQVSERGDLANWIIPGKMVKGMGGAMDLVGGAKKRIVVMQHSTKNGRNKILRECSLPLTGSKVVSALITEKAVFQWDKLGKMFLTDVATESSVEDVKAHTEAIFHVDDNLATF
jgi:3-oxoacid CoA-transferase